MRRCQHTPERSLSPRFCFLFRIGVFIGHKKSIGAIPGDFNPNIVFLIGAIMTWWARLEGLFVFEILILREKPSAKSVTVKERLPSGTGRRIKHWGKLMRLLYSDQPKSLKVIQDLMVESLELAGERNVLMHSFWPYTQENPDEVQLHNLKIDPTDTSQHQETVYVANVEELDDLNERIRRLYVRMVAVAFNASQKAPPFQSS